MVCRVAVAFVMGFGLVSFVFCVFDLIFVFL